MFKVKHRVYGKAADGRAILLYAAGAVISDDAARRCGLLAGKPADEEPARGLTIKPEVDRDATDQPEPPKPIVRMRLAELAALCEEEGIDPGDANTRAEYIAAIEVARESQEA